MSDDGKLPVVVLISGGGSNLQALIDDAGADAPYEVVGVISNKADAHGLQRAQRAGIATRVLDHRGFPDREAFDTALAELIDGFRPGLVVLAGFMRILTPGFVRHYAGRMLNIHPSLLPKYQGLNTHARALEAGDDAHGCSVHFVTDELDGGPVIAQARVPVLAGDTPGQLAERVLAEEHRLYPAVVRALAAGRVRLTPQGVELDGAALETPARLDALTGGSEASHQ